MWRAGTCRRNTTHVHVHVRTRWLSTFDLPLARLVPTCDEGFPGEHLGPACHGTWAHLRACSHHDRRQAFRLKVMRVSVRPAVLSAGRCALSWCCRWYRITSLCYVGPESPLRRLTCQWQCSTLRTLLPLHLSTARAHHTRGRCHVAASMSPATVKQLVAPDGRGLLRAGAPQGILAGVRSTKLAMLLSQPRVLTRACP